ncbi:MAG: polyprenyl synthetase family protein [Liquorilactobacillus ghanensis]|jgi:heptaprenyl diphosphate synthase|uniref:Polyprenyl diphosphate synthase n=1 Tax=Liquorilactobacillus ghanensis DSM 18630 TaxID=1423750 RepID=A0A0R1VW25_9LACO|nr:polyprenyl synthetase family protein [Liquorilactobacillus ghanensis]KRM05804.1 polyprenyl diphosphate synthase [Liquorilactobacillus ghanensis DSM 18630]
MLDLWKRYPQVDKQLNDVNSLIKKLMVSDNSAIQSLLDDCARQQGKMLRPGLFLLFSQLAQNSTAKTDRLIKIAASLEILHQATLIHDDIIDDSPLRRGTITLQAKYGKDTAVYAGDLLFTVFFQLLIETMNGTHYLKINADTMQRLLQGELSQMAARFQQQPVAAYLDNIRGKTAALFRLACLEGAYFGGSDPTTTKLAGEIGENIGMAFQIFDDILDYSSSTGVLKKPVLEDVAQGVYTLPLLLAYQTAPTEFKELLAKKQQITKGEVRQIAHLVKKHHGTEQAKLLAKDYTQKATAKIAQLPVTPVSQKIAQLAQKLLQRTF